MNLKDWSIQDAIKERVRQEDLALWAGRKDEEFVPKPPLPSTKWSPTVKKVFGLNLFKFIPNLMP
jgi:hypothetical protein